MRVLIACEESQAVTIEMSEELKPCPFCGELPKLYTMSDNSCNDYWEIGCAGEECPTNPSAMSFISIEDAIDKWNTRVGDNND